MNIHIAGPIFDEFPEAYLGLVIAHELDNSRENPEVIELLRAAEAQLPGKFGDLPVIQHPHIEPWREAYRRFGARPKNYPSSIENLARRVLQGIALPHINNLVTLYNTISLKYILPVGGEDLDKITGDVLLTRAGEAEPAVVLLGEQDARPPHPGEVIYKDDVGAICRRWNWKEADRTKLTKETRSCFLVIESLPPVSRDTVATAVRELRDLVETYCGGKVSTAFLDIDNRSARLK